MIVFCGKADTHTQKKPLNKFIDQCEFHSTMKFYRFQPTQTILMCMSYSDRNTNSHYILPLFVNLLINNGECVVYHGDMVTIGYKEWSDKVERRRERESKLKQPVIFQRIDTTDCVMWKYDTYSIDMYINTNTEHLKRADCLLGHKYRYIELAIQSGAHHFVCSTHTHMPHEFST